MYIYRYSSSVSELEQLSVAQGPYSPAYSGASTWQTFSTLSSADLLAVRESSREKYIRRAYTLERSRYPPGTGFALLGNLVLGIWSRLGFVIYKDVGSRGHRVPGDNATPRGGPSALCVN